MTCSKNDEFKNDLNFSFSLPDILEAWSRQWDYCVTNGVFAEERVDVITSQNVILSVDYGTGNFEGLSG